MIERWMIALAALTLVGCGGEQTPVAKIEAVKAGDPVIEAGPPPIPRVTKSREPLGYTSLKAEDCELLEENREEAGYSRHRCKGLGGYNLETTESDLRQDLIVIQSSRTPLGLSSKVAKGSFNSLGPTAEWRGALHFERPRPTALIVRLNVANGAEPNTPDTSNLVVIELGGSSSCIEAVIPPGPDQNERAREVADRLRGICL